MSSERLYHTDSYLTAFDAEVRTVAPQGEQWLVTLDRTAFYPASGGQPNDVGTLGEAHVLDVVDLEDGTVGHVVDKALVLNEQVRGAIAWERRFDHMQQHSGQHLLSAAFDREHAARTASFHLGNTSSTIDLDRGVSAEQIAATELAANKVIWEDRSLTVRSVSPAEAAKLPLRKDPTRSGDLRIVEIADYDLSACGGTHVCRTGAIGMIAIAGFERFKGGIRVEFVCGARALRACRSLRDSVTSSVRLLSVLPEELPSAIEKLQTEGRGQKKAQEALRDQLAVHEATALAARGSRTGGIRLVTESVAGWDAAGLKKLASAVTSNPGFIAALISAESPFTIVVARSENLTLDAGVMLKHLIERFGGKGGGKGPMAQGGGLNGSAQEILTAAREIAAAAGLRRGR